MKKLTKIYKSNDPKLLNFQLGDYGSFINMMKNILCGDGFNETPINKIEIVGDKQVKFSFSMPNEYSHNFKNNEVVHLKGLKNEEYVIIDTKPEFILCEYYEDYVITTNTSYVGSIVASSLGFKEVSTDQNGKWTIQNENEKFLYHFYDKESTNFKNANTYKFVGVHMQSKEVLHLVVPDNATTTDYNNISEWAPTEYPNAHRRYLHSFLYTANAKYTIIGNGDFVFIIIYFPNDNSFRNRLSTIYCFGEYKTNLHNNPNNSLLVSCDYYQANATMNSSNICSTNNFKNRFGSNSTVNMPEYYPYALSRNLTTTYNTIVSNQVATTFIPGVNLSSHFYNANLLYGINASASFFILPKAILSPSSVLSSGGSYLYPNIDNKMIYCGVDIMSAISNSEHIYNFGQMPFMLWWGHTNSTIPSPGEIIKVREGENDTRLLYSHNSDQSSSNGSGAWFFDVTPKNYSQYL